MNFLTLSPLHRQGAFFIGLIQRDLTDETGTVQAEMGFGIKQISAILET